jgi:EAL and modified HD-GYP domain-containing signal transduction protein
MRCDGESRPAVLKAPDAAEVHRMAAPQRTLATDVCVARQPIFGVAGHLVGYELLYRRASTDTAARGESREVMGPDVVVHAFLNIGLDRLTAGHLAYVNFTREMLLGGAFTLLPRGAVVIELLESVRPDEDVEAACADAVDAGYVLALDDFTWAPEYERLLDLASIVKVDVLDRPAEALDEIARRLAVYDVQLLAERVETAEVRAACAGLGYELFQGYYFARPEVVQKRTLVSDERAIVQAMNVLRDPATNDNEVERSFQADLGLTYKLLRMVNTAAYGGRGIESIRHAVQLSGREELYKWLALMLVSSIAARGGANRELLRLAVQRGRLCELLAATTGRAREAGALFMVGLFSLLDAIAATPLTELLESIALAPPIREALLGRRGPYAPPLAIAEAFERGAWGAVTRETHTAGIDPSTVGELYVQSLAWTRERLLAVTGA